MQKLGIHAQLSSGYIVITIKKLPIARYIRFYCIYPVKIQQNMFNMSYIYAITGAKSSRKRLLLKNKLLCT